MRRFSATTVAVPRARAWRRLACIWMVASFAFSFSLSTRADPFFINEIFFNPPGSDAPNEWVELRGVPNQAFPEGSFLLGIEGDAANNPGTVQDIFDLSGRVIGGNGFLLLLQNGHSYRPHPQANVLVQTGDEPGWGHGSGSTVKHRGEGGQTDIENASLTFLLLRTDADIGIGDDLDDDDDGELDADWLPQATLYDSAGVLDADGLGDIAYGRLNFRRSAPPGNRATAGGTVVPLGFTPTWIGRLANSTGYKATDWAASDIASLTPVPALGDASKTYPATLANAPLNHLGAPNFGASPVPGVVVIPPADPSAIPEAGGVVQYRVGLSLAPSGEVLIQVEAPADLEVSLDKGLTYGAARQLRFVNGDFQTVWARAVDNPDVETPVRKVKLLHRLASTQDPRFAGALIPALEIEIQNDDALLLNEVSVNPPGLDQEHEFVELRGKPGARLTDVYLVVVESDVQHDLGTARRVVSLDGARLGKNGLLVLTAAEHFELLDGATALFPLPRSDEGGAGYLPNDSLSLLLVASPSPIEEGKDLDAGNNGVLEGLPKQSQVLDSLAWRGIAEGDLVYGTVLEDRASSPPDAATRFPGNDLPNEATAWYFGDLKSSDLSGLRYDRSLSSTNLPLGALLTPGGANNTLPRLSRLDATCGAIGDPTNPTVSFSVADNESSPAQMRVLALSDHQEVIPDANLTLESKGGGLWVLHLNPVGVGYARISVEASDGVLSARESFDYAVSGRADERTRYLIGAGDGSTAIPLEGKWILVGDDENQMIRLYDREKSDLPQARFPMTPYLGLVDVEGGVPREVDIEGSTRVGNRIFWMGAHSHANIGEIRVNRGRIFATDVVDAGPSTTLAYVGRYDHLKEDLVDWDVRNLHGRGANYYGLADSTADGVDPKSRDGSGFNLEGLCLAPGSIETAYVACRAPLVPAHRRTHALIVPVTNFTSLAVSDAGPGAARFGDPIELDLFGRGIRSIEGVGNSYLIVAGPPGQAPGRYPEDFRLYTWTGNPADPPQLRSASLVGLNPEGIVSLPAPPWTEATEFQLLSDNGTRVWYGDGIITKLLPETNFKKCRLDWISLGSVETPQPLIREVRLASDGATVIWRGLSGVTYRLQWCDQLEPLEWRDVAGDVTAVEVVLEKRHLAPVVGNRYYRLIVVEAAAKRL